MSLSHMSLAVHPRAGPVHRHIWSSLLWNGGGQTGMGKGPFKSCREKRVRESGCPWINEES